jgi:hypothetical protein
VSIIKYLTHVGARHIQNSFQVKGCCIHRLVGFSPFFVVLLFFTCPLFELAPALSQGLPRCVRHVVLYSDCYTGQNRNQYITTGLLHTLQNSGNLETIEHNFLESGHTQMECDSMHSMIEQAKKRTSIIFL